VQENVTFVKDLREQVEFPVNPRRRVASSHRGAAV